MSGAVLNSIQQVAKSASSLGRQGVAWVMCTRGISVSVLLLWGERRRGSV